MDVGKVHFETVLVFVGGEGHFGEMAGLREGAQGGGVEG